MDFNTAFILQFLKIEKIIELQMIFHQKDDYYFDTALQYLPIK